MKWSPRYTISPRLLKTIRTIGETYTAIGTAPLSQPALAKLVTTARSLSSFASTSIEGNPLPLTDVKRLLKQSPTQIRDTEREVLNYNRALEWVSAKVEAGKFEVTTETFVSIQGIVTEGLMENPADIGKIRQRPVVIRDPSKPGSIVFMPPDHGDVQDLCKNLFSFISDQMNDLDPILLAGIFHKQAVLIHPFMDGNGRSTRLMTTGLLGALGVDIFPIFSFESYYNRNVSRYFRLVGEQGDYYELKDDIDFTVWLEYFAEGVLDEFKRVQKTLPTKAVRLEPHHQELLNYLDEHGSITQREYGAISERGLAARKKDFARLVTLNLIEAVGGGRSTYYRRK